MLYGFLEKLELLCSCFNLLFLYLSVTGLALGPIWLFLLRIQGRGVIRLEFSAFWRSSSSAGPLPPSPPPPGWIPSSWQPSVGYGSWTRPPSSAVWRTCSRIWKPSSTLASRCWLMGGDRGGQFHRSHWDSIICTYNLPRRSLTWALSSEIWG